MKNGKNLGIILFLTGLLVGQSPTISRIAVIGHKVTKEYIIRREIQHPIGAPLDSSLAVEDRNRIENLGIFAAVEWKIVPEMDGTARIEYSVTESWPRIIPIPYPDYDEERGWSYGLALIVRNFQGRNQNLMLGGQTGARDLYGVFFSDPWITGDHISLNSSIGKAYVSHSFLQYNIATTTLEMNMGSYFGYQHKLSLGFELEKTSYLGTSDTLNFSYIAPQAQYIYDTRDIYLEPTKGVRISQNIYTMFDFSGGSNRTFWTHSYSIYHSLIGGPRRLVMGFNTKSRISVGDKRDVYSVYIGSNNTVRGWTPPNRTVYAAGTQKYRFGHHWVVSSLELRQTIIPKFVTRWETEFGLTAIAFLDFGFAGQSLSGLLKQSPMLGTGVGLRINWPWVRMFRIDAGWGFKDGLQVDNYLHISAGQKF